MIKYSKAMGILFFLIAIIVNSFAFPHSVAKAQGPGGPYGPPIWPPTIIKDGESEWLDPSQWDFQGVHYGVDWDAWQGDAVYSSCPGQVVFYGNWHGWVNTTWIKCQGEDVWFGTSHLDDGRPHLNPGDPVYQGQQIAEVGAIEVSGNGDRDHPHLMKMLQDPLTVDISTLPWVNPLEGMDLSLKPVDAPDDSTTPAPAQPEVVFPPAEAGMNPNPQLGKVHHFSIPAQATFSSGYTDPGYEKNVRTYWAFTSPGNRNLATYQTINLYEFEGFIELPPKQRLDTELIHGPYGSAQGMVNIGVGSVIMGGGACNTNGMEAQVAWYSGLKINITCNYHPYVPGVEKRFLSTVQTGSDCTVYITNPTDTMLYYHWRVSGDDLALWVDNIPGAAGFTPSDTFVAGSTGSSSYTTTTNEIPVYAVDVEFDVSRLMSEDTVFAPISSPLGEEDVIPPAVGTVLEAVSDPNASQIPIGNGKQIDKQRGAAIALVILLFILLRGRNEDDED